MPEKILVVEDNAAMRLSLVRLLLEESYQVAEAVDGEDGLAQYASFTPDLVIMDINMPRMNGLEAVKHLREFSGVPILILSVRSNEMDKVYGLDVGADDYLAKPFGAEELLARVRSLLRRRVHEKLATKPDVLRLGGGELVIDLGRQQVLLNGQLVRLTPIESRLLFTLAERPGEPFTHRQLRDAVWQGDPSGTTQNLKLYILYLRRKIEPEPENPQYLLTVRGAGYMLAAL